GGMEGGEVGDSSDRQGANNKTAPGSVRTRGQTSAEPQRASATSAAVPGASHGNPTAVSPGSDRLTAASLQSEERRAKSRELRAKSKTEIVLALRSLLSALNSRLVMPTRTPV